MYPSLSRFRSILSTWLAGVVPWLLLLMLFVPGSFVFDSESSHPYGLKRLVLHYATIYAPWSIFALFVRALLRRAPLPWPIDVRAALLHTALLIVLIAGHSLFVTICDAHGLFVHGGPSHGFARRLVVVSLYMAPLDLIVYAAVAGFLSALDAWKRVHQREQSLIQAQLEALKAQIEPHFLFNALNALSELVYTDPAATDRAITQLARLLRRIFDEGGHRQTLRDEVAQLREYMNIHKILLGDRLRVSWNIPDEFLEAVVPTRLLQPLFENAVRHGIARLRDGGTIELVVSRIGARLCLAINNDGPAHAGVHVREGVGLGNTRARLQALYGGRQQMRAAFPDAGGGSVTIVLPLEEGLGIG